MCVVLANDLYSHPNTLDVMFIWHITRLRDRFLKKNSGNAEFERRRREDRGAPRGVGCGEAVSPPHREGSEKGAVPLPKKFFDFEP